MKLDNFVHIPLGLQEENKNCCWIACAAMLIKYFSDLDYSVDSLARSLGLDKSTQGSPIDILARVYRGIYSFSDMPMDNHALPTIEEIEWEIAGHNSTRTKRPLLCCVGTEEPTIIDSYTERPMGNPEYNNGHWIIITGINRESGKCKLNISDPALCSPTEVDYDIKEYKRCGLEGKYYWENTTYFNFFGSRPYQVV